jgi:hypothetical protein
VFGVDGLKDDEKNFKKNKKQGMRRKMDDKSVLSKLNETQMK